jgi:hypothetical protein
MSEAQMSEAQEAPEVEVNTTPPSTSEIETPSESVETSEVATSEQPAEEKPNRSQQRIQELSKKAKEADERATYWETLAKQGEPQPEPAATGDDEEFGVDQLADAVVQRLERGSHEEKAQKAQKELTEDLITVLQKYPELDSDDELAELIVARAQAKGIRLSAAADQVMGKIAEKAKLTEKKVLADEAARSGNPSGNGTKVSTSEPVKKNVDLMKMTKDEEKDNWSQILESYQK